MPEEFKHLTIWPEEEDSALSIIVFIENTKNSPEPHSITLRSSVYFGALVDKKKCIIKYVDVHLQEHSALNELFSDVDQTVLKQTLDHDWQHHRQCFEQLNTCIQLGIEDTPFPSIDINGTKSFNPQKTQIFVTDAAPISFRQWKNFLEKDEPNTLSPLLENSNIYSELLPKTGTAFREDRFLQTINQPTKHLLESFHLKLAYLLDCFHLIKEHTKILARPLLSISPDSFGVSLTENTKGLPLLWSGKIHLRDLGSTIKDPFTSNIVKASSGKSSIYQMPGNSDSCIGTGELHIQSIQRSESNPLANIKIILTGHNINQVTAKSKVRVCFDSPEGKFTLQGSILEQLDEVRCLIKVEEKNYPEWFTSIEEGYTKACRYIIQPVLSSAYDLYSLGILNIYLLQGEQPISAYLESFKFIGKHLPESFSEKEFADILHQHKEDLSVLGTLQIPEPMQAQTLTFILKLLTNFHPTCYASKEDSHDATISHQLYNFPIKDLRNIVRQSRSEALNETKRNQEIQKVIDQVLGNSK